MVVTQLSYLGSHTPLLFIFDSLVTLWVSAVTSIGAIFSFPPLPSLPLPLPIFSPPSSPYMWRPEADVCLPLYLSTLLFTL